MALQLNNVPQYVIDFVKTCTDKNGNLSSRKASNIPVDVRAWLDLEQDWSVRIIHNMLRLKLETLSNVCPECGTKLSPEQIAKGHTYCCNRCAQKSDEVQSRIRQTNLERFGVEYSMQNKELHERAMQTCIEKYGCVVAANTEENREKIKQKNIEQYGFEHPMKNPEIAQKRNQLYRKTCLEKYGFENAAQSQVVRDKIAYFKRKKSFDNTIKILDKFNISILSSENDYFERKPVYLKCNKCNREFEVQGNIPLRLVRCPDCKYTFTVSNIEQEIADWIKSVYHGTVLQSDRTYIAPLELDIFIPEKNLAIEVNGIYWHSEIYKDKNYHLIKHNSCAAIGCRLIQITDVDWYTKQDIVKSIILHALGIHSRVIHGRKCTIHEISMVEYADFLNENHISEAVMSGRRLGMIFDNELVAVFGFGLSRFHDNSIDNNIELHRFCIKNNTHIHGALSKFLKYVSDNYAIESLISYVDLDYFNGTGYIKSGFSVLKQNTGPGFCYCNIDGNILSRHAAQKSKLRLLFDDVTDDMLDSMTEHEIMNYHDYYRYYNAGNMKVEFSFEK